MRALVVLGMTLVCLGVAPAASAQEPSAPHDRATAALREGRFADALALFRQAAQAGTDASAWLRVGDAADRLRDDAAALDAYERYLAARPEASDRVEIVARIDVLRAVLARQAAPPRRADHGFIPATTILDALRETPASTPPRGLGHQLDPP